MHSCLCVIKLYFFSFELNEIIITVLPHICNYESTCFSPAKLDEQDSELSPEHVLLTNAYDCSSNYFD